MVSSAGGDVQSRRHQPTAVAASCRGSRSGLRLPIPRGARPPPPPPPGSRMCQLGGGSAWRCSRLPTRFHGVGGGAETHLPGPHSHGNTLVGRDDPDRDCGGWLGTWGRGG